MRERLKYQIWLQVAVLIFGFTGVLGKLISLDAYQLVWYRLAIAIAALGVYLRMRGEKLGADSAVVLRLLGVGVILGFHWITFFEAIKRSNVSVSLVCFSSVALFTSFIEPFYYKRRIAWREPLFAGCVVVGLYLVFRSEFSYAAGMALSVVSAALAGWFTVLNGVLVRSHGASAITFYELLGAFLTVSLCLLFGFGAGLPDFAISLRDTGWLLILGLLCTAFSFMLGVRLIKVITPYSFAMAVNLEPIYAILMAVLIWPETETMSREFYFAAAIVVVVLCLSAFAQRRAARLTGN